MKKLLLTAVTTSALTLASLFSVSAQAADYKIDTAGAHAFVQFKIKHLGYSWLLGRFNTFDGEFSYDAAAPEKSEIEVVIETASLDSNHADRDKHLKGSDFLDVKKFPKAVFKSTGFEVKDDNNAVVTGTFMLHGVKKTISFPVEKIGEGKDPWGGYRVGFEANTALKFSDFGIDAKGKIGTDEFKLNFFVEGVKKS